MQSAEFAIVDVITKLLLQIVMPLIIGLLLQRFLGHFARTHNRKLGLFDKSVIVLIVFSSFSNSFSSNLFSTIEITDLLKLTLIVVLLFFSVYYIIGYLCKLMNFSIEDTITAKFAGTKKSLVHGSVMAKIIFGTSASLGLFLLPIMIYHILQLLVIAVFAENYRRKWVKQESLR